MLSKHEFRIVNEEGCWITTEVNRGIGEPNFEYTSPNYEASSAFSKKEVTFKTSTDPYVKSEWILEIIQLQKLFLR